MRMQNIQTTACGNHVDCSRDRSLIRRIKDDAQRDSIIREFAPVPGSKIGELAAKFDIVMGFTPGDM